MLVAELRRVAPLADPVPEAWRPSPSRASPGRRSRRSGPLAYDSRARRRGRRPRARGRHRCRRGRPTRPAAGHRARAGRRCRQVRLLGHLVPARPAAVVVLWPEGHAERPATSGGRSGSTSCRGDRCSCTWRPIRRSNGWVHRLTPPGSARPAGRAAMAARAAATSSLAPMSRSFWVETLGCPKNQVDSDKLKRDDARGQARPRRRARAGDLVVVNTAPSSTRPARFDRRRWRCPSASRCRPSWLVTAAWPALRRRAGRACRRPTPSQASACRSRWAATLGTTVAPSLDLLNPAAGPARRGLCEGLGGRDRGCCFMRHPSSGASSAAAASTASRRRVRPARRLRRARGGDGRRTWPPSVATRACEAQHRSLVEVLARQVDARAPLYLYPSYLTPALSTASAPPACPTSTCRCSTPRPRCCAACGDGATVTGSGVASTTSVRASPMRRSVRASSSAIRARPRTTTTSCCASWPTPTSTGPASSPTAPRTAPTPPTSMARYPTAWSPTGSSSCATCRTTSPPTAATRSSVVR